jgi:integrase
MLGFAEFLQNSGPNMPKISRERLTVQKVNSARATGKLYMLRDAEVAGLVLRVNPQGVKTWAVHWGRGQARNLSRSLTLDAARVEARKLLTEIDQHGAPLAVVAANAPAVATFGDFISKRYGPHIEATAKAGKQTHALITKHFGYLDDEPLTGVTRAVFDKFKAKRLKDGIHPATVNRDLARLKAALSVAVQWKLLDVNPLLGVKRIKAGIEDRIRYLSKAEEKALRKTLEKREAKFRRRRESGNRWRAERGREQKPAITGYCDHLMPMTLIALNTGLRRGELTSLTWADINLPGKMLTVRAGYAKSGKARHVPLNSEAVAVFKQWRKQEPEGRLFKVICTAKAWGALMTAAKIENFRFHDCRHSFASKLVMAGVDLNTVRELLGHGDIAMTMRYAHLAPEHKAAAVEKLVR